jgi:hypothetical protein
MALLGDFNQIGVFRKMPIFRKIKNIFENGFEI